MIRTEIYGFEAFEKLAATWPEIANLDPAATPFQTLEWQRTWFKHFGSGKKPLIWTAWSGHDLVALMPFVKVRSPWRALRPMGCGPSDYLQPIVRPGFEDAAAAALAEFLVDESRKRLVDVHQLRETLPLAAALAEIAPEAKAFEQATCLVLELPDTYEAYLKELGKSLRYDVKKLEKPPFTDSRARVTPVGASDAVAGVDFFFEAHKKRWSKRGLPGAFLGSKIRDFHREWAVLAAEREWLWMSRLELEGKPVGAIYAMRKGGTCFFYQSGFDPAHSAISPGTLLVASTIRRAIEEGLSQFDFLRGDEPYKRRWKPQSSYRNLRIMLGSDGVLPKLGERWNRAAFKLESKVRARFEGKGLR
ncbi:MAG TPA: GNAT family N-acetyltransferase [Fimbriimonadaceae bacterium]|nr:GNAT family N-acetyltransferase [Fimbriimonadaceae bacterium]